MLVVAGLSLKNLHPRVWDPSSPYWLSALRAVMVSYADFHRQPRQRDVALRLGLRAYLGVPAGVDVYLDNGAFSFSLRGEDTPRTAYEEFVAHAGPGWHPVPQDFIPLPSMTNAEQRSCLRRTMAVNQAYEHDGYVPVIHISQVLPEYIAAVQAHDRLMAKSALALGGIVPNLLRAPRAMPYADILGSLRRVRQLFSGKRLHVFGIGGTATIHLAALMAIDSADSSGWRNRAARGLVQLAGSGDRVVANLGNWRGREPSPTEWARLAACPCPACRRFGLASLQASGRDGFSHRATHNLWVLLEEAALVEQRLADGSYPGWYEEHLDNTIYLPLIRQALQRCEQRHEPAAETGRD